MGFINVTERKVKKRDHDRASEHVKREKHEQQQQHGTHKKKGREKETDVAVCIAPIPWTPSQQATEMRL